MQSGTVSDCDACWDPHVIAVTEARWDSLGPVPAASGGTTSSKIPGELLHCQTSFEFTDVHSAVAAVPGLCGILHGSFVLSFILFRNSASCRNRLLPDACSPSGPVAATADSILVFFHHQCLCFCPARCMHDALLLSSVLVLLTHAEHCRAVALALGGCDLCLVVVP